MSGNALYNIEIKKIHKTDINETLLYLKRLCREFNFDYTVVGSAATNAEYSGDIDLIIDKSKVDQKRFANDMRYILGHDCVKELHGLDIVSLGIDILGNTIFGKCQIDVMFVESIPWARFIHGVDCPKSKYKNAVRVILLNSIASVFGTSSIDYFKYNDNDELIIRAGRTIKNNTGLVRIFQYRAFDEKNNKWRKTLKTISFEDFKEKFPDIKLFDGNYTISDPHKFVNNVIFNVESGHYINKVDTAEKLINIISSKKDKDLIWDIASERCRSLYYNDYKLPEEIITRLIK